MEGFSPAELSAPSPGDDVRLKLAICLRGQPVTQRLFLGNRLQFLCGNDTVAVAMHFAMKMAKFASRCGNSLRCRLRFEKSLAIAVAMPWCTQLQNEPKNPRRP